MGQDVGSPSRGEEEDTGEGVGGETEGERERQVEKTLL